MSTDRLSSALGERGQARNEIRYEKVKVMTTAEYEMVRGPGE